MPRASSLRTRSTEATARENRKKAWRRKERATTKSLPAKTRTLFPRCMRTGFARRRRALDGRSEERTMEQLSRKPVGNGFRARLQCGLPAKGDISSQRQQKSDKDADVEKNAKNLGDHQKRPDHELEDFALSPNTHKSRTHPVHAARRGVDARRCSRTKVTRKAACAEDESLRRGALCVSAARCSNATARISH